ncbi:MAG: tRNA pseudouridine(55) synthase TruB [Planctomycetaceae bacterium]|nr:tRNA pseudouridine(55) synthase TruB [Planctomycetaceae bacterium]
MAAGKRRRGSVDGLLNVAKPAGMTSRRVVDRVLSLVAPAKVGHAGTLDPMATGVLVICIGAATRLISFVQEQRKTYRAEFLLGRRSDTDDVTGQVEEVPGTTALPRATVEQALRRFVGRISQVPPQFSAVHVEGKRAHQLARRGKEVDIAPRDVDFYRIDVIDFEWPRLIVEIECGSGTYVRSIGRDLGNVLGCGGVMSALERTAIGSFQVSDALEFEALTRESITAGLRPIGDAIPGMPHVTVTDEDIVQMRMGQRVGTPTGPATEAPRVACYSGEGRLVALADTCDGGSRLQPTLVFPDAFDVAS